MDRRENYDRKRKGQVRARGTTTQRSGYQPTAAATATTVLQEYLEHLYRVR